MFAAFCHQPTSSPVSTVLTYTVLYLSSCLQVFPKAGSLLSLGRFPFRPFQFPSWEGPPSGESVPQALRGKERAKTLWKQAGRSGKEGIPPSGDIRPSWTKAARAGPLDGLEKRQGQRRLVEAARLWSFTRSLLCWHTEQLCRPFQAPGLSVLCVWLPQPRGPEWEGRSRTRDGLFSNNSAILCLKMSSAKHALSPYSPRPRGERSGRLV